MIYPYKTPLKGGTSSDMNYLTKPDFGVAKNLGKPKGQEVWSS